MDLDQALAVFVTESRELLADMESALLAVEQAEPKDELVNAIFRAAHTIKGSSGLFGLDHVVSFTHGVESVLDQVRAGALPIADRLVVLLLSCRDHLVSLIDTVASGRTEADAQLTASGQPLEAALRAYLAAPGGAAIPAPAPLPQAQAKALPAQTGGDVARPHDATVDSEHWHLSLRFGPDVLRNGMDPLSFFSFMDTMGHIVHIATVADALPDADAMDPEACYLGFELAYQTDADKAAIEAVFEFVRDDSRITLLPPRSRIADYVRLIEQQGDAARLGEMLVRCGTLTERELALALTAQAAAPDERIGSLLVQQGSVPPQVVEAALQKQKLVKDTVAHESRSIRVDADKLDQLINLVGELIIAGASVNLIAHRARITELQESTSKLSMLVEEVRDSALQLRMVKIGATFGRFQRVVHDVSRDLGKDVGLVISGEDTELDKTVIEKISDPLMHLVRNAMDHGIESAERRAARGKPAQGTLSLNAFHDSGSIVITVEDDGGGLDRERILAKAVERGLVEAGRTLTDAEVYALIFEPGFSTAETVTNLSGRGVGLDVVKRNITELRGTVELSSVAGVGTTVTVRLPLTLAIIDGFLVGVGKSVFALPLDMIEECVAFSAEPGHNYTNLRGEVLPFIRLRELFRVSGQSGRSENIVVLKHGDQRAGVVVDTLLGEFQTVIKPLGPMFSHVKCVSGSTILGSGEVALILDVPAIVGRCVNNDRRITGQAHQVLEALAS
ncbi:chemotaxis protein CheA [Ideonella sp. A 288]|uniref:chemotaxis protein CheA n=1 Tax=Ideonella sp. A 288 TaxID=1962181 RepID=UPI000B4B87B0|nr:chemotaxis protein CheA [Ideonella sp. A 288]